MGDHVIADIMALYIAHVILSLSPILHVHVHACIPHVQEYCTTEFLRVSGVYWGLTAMDLMGQLHRMNRSEVIEFVKSCQHPTEGGFSPTLHHDPHLLYTLSAVQVCICVCVCVCVCVYVCVSERARARKRERER